jgi:hypothetical protein
MIKRIDDPEGTGFSVVKTADLEALEKLCVIGWHYAEIEGQVVTPQTVEKVGDLHDLFSDYEEYKDIQARLEKLFE